MKSPPPERAFTFGTVLLAKASAAAKLVLGAWFSGAIALLNVSVEMSRVD